MGSTLVLQLMAMLLLALLATASATSDPYEVDAMLDPYDLDAADRLIAYAHAAREAPLSLLASAFGSSMVLKADGAVLFGNAAEEGVSVEVTAVDRASGAVVAFATATSGAAGSWNATIDVPASLADHTVSVSGSGGHGQTVTLTNVLFGDVLLCSGQSNMDFCLGGLGKCWGGAFAANATVAAAHQYPEIRLFKASGCPGAHGWEPSWNGNASDTVQRPLRDFSAVCYLTAVALKQSLGGMAKRRPFGLIQASVGGTVIETWSPASVARACGIHGALDGGPSACASAQKYAALYDAAIAPLVPLRLTAALWYQGESNTGCNHGPGVTPPLSEGYYACMQREMVNAWRTAFGQRFPFLVVQLAAFNATDASPYSRGTDTYVALRSAQSAAVHALERTGIALAIDLGDDGKRPYTPPSPRHGGIHPRNKTEVARRLALAYAAIVGGTIGAHAAASGPWTLDPGRWSLDSGAHAATSGPVSIAAAARGNGTAVRVTFAPGPSAEGLRLVPTAQCHSHGRLAAKADCCAQAVAFNPAGMPFEVRLADGSYHLAAAHVVQGQGNGHAQGAHNEIGSGGRRTATEAVELTVATSAQGAKGGVERDVAAVRYGAQGYPLCVLSNAAGLPADMFELSVSQR